MAVAITVGRTLIMVEANDEEALQEVVDKIVSGVNAAITDFEARITALEP